MLKGAVAGRYAEALYEIASQKNLVDRIESELKAVEAVLKENVDLQRVLYHPQITAESKKGLLEQLFKGKVSGITGNFLALLVDRRREVFFADIVAEFVKLANAGRNIVAAQVTSAVELNNEEKGKLDQVLARLTGKKVQTSYAVDPSLIGGVVVRMGDKIIDGSIKTRLATLKERLKAIS
ncbi:MAG: F0F1 ATP synthase subunit delta [Peptococcaceae bacterium]|nr:F0F1 ATP synthase subunit delta [Peptococcaceae bacterium]